MRKYILGSAVAALVAGTSAAQAAPVSAPVADSRSSSPVDDSEQLGAPILIALLAAGALAVVLVGINDDNNDEDLPTSP